MHRRDGLSGRWFTPRSLRGLAVVLGLVASGESLAQANICPMVASPASFSCPSGYTLSGNQCTFVYAASTNTSTYNATPQCSAGTLSGGQCVSTSTSLIPLCPAGYVYDNTEVASGSCFPLNETDPVLDPYACAANGGTITSTAGRGQCTIKSTQTTPPTFVCANGGTLNGTQCAVGTGPTCPNGGTLNGATNQCTITQAPTVTQTIASSLCSAIIAPGTIAAGQTLSNQASNVALDHFDEIHSQARTGDVCTGGRVLVDGQCACPADQTLVNGQCVAPTSPVSAYAPLVAAYPSPLVHKGSFAPSAAPAPAPTSDGRPSVWARAFGDYESRNANGSATLFGTTVTTVNGVVTATAPFSNTSFANFGFTQRSAGIQGGVDFKFRNLTSAGDSLTVGILGGGLTSSVEFKSIRSSVEFAGGSVGALATYLRGPFFTDLLVRADILNLDVAFTDPAGVASASGSTGLVNYVGLANIGYTIDLPNRWYVEPTARLDYVHSVFGTGTFLLGLGDSTMLRGRVGVKVGEVLTFGRLRVEPSVAGFVYSVLSASDNGVGFSATSLSISLPGDVGKARGEVQAALNLLDLPSGFSGFVRGDVRFGEDLFGAGGRVGIRYQW